MQNQARNMIHVDTNIAKRRIIFEEISNKHHSKLKRFLRRFHSEHNVCVFDVFEYWASLSIVPVINHKLRCHSFLSLLYLVAQHYLVTVNQYPVDVRFQRVKVSMSFEKEGIGLSFLRVQLTDAICLPHFKRWSFVNYFQYCCNLELPANYVKLCRLIQGII